MINENKRKVEGGKFARIGIEITDNSISSVKITGDFFLHPENVLEKIEDALKGTKLPFNAVEAEKKIVEVLEAEKAKLVGVSAKDIAEMIDECVK